MRSRTAHSDKLGQGIPDFKNVAKEIMESKDLDEVVIIYEAGKVVHIGLVENVSQKDLYERITEIFKGLTGPKFYGRLRLQYKNGEIGLARLEKNIKL